jgi:hypothetical protein
VIVLQSFTNSGDRANESAPFFEAYRGTRMAMNQYKRRFHSRDTLNSSSRELGKVRRDSGTTI